MELLPVLCPTLILGLIVTGLTHASAINRSALAPVVSAETGAKAHRLIFTRRATRDFLFGTKSCMNWTTAYYAFFVAPAVLWFVNQFLFRNRIHWFLLYAIAIVSCYGLLLLSVRLLDSQLEAELYKHDLDGDRAFSGAEDTAAMREAMERLTNDTGRALAPVTGVPISLFWVTLNYIPLGLVSLVIWRFRSHRGDFDSADDHSDRVDPGIVSVATCDNPYSPPRTNHRR